MNSSMACPYDSCELAAASEFRTAFFDCSRSGSRSIDLARERFFVFFQRPILAASCAAFSMVVHLAGYGPERRFWCRTLGALEWSTLLFPLRATSSRYIIYEW